MRRWLLHSFSGLALTLVLVLPGFAAQAPSQVQVADIPYEPESGDAWIDRRLEDINLYAWRYTDSFLDELSRYGGMPRSYADSLMRNQQWMPGDVYLAAVLAMVAVQGSGPRPFAAPRRVLGRNTGAIDR